MLILTRKHNESIVIGNDIRITVLGIQNGIVRVGLTAPDHVKIFREELLTRSIKSDQTDEEITNSADSDPKASSTEIKPASDTTG